jgi:hypothetical protein
MRNKKDQILLACEFKALSVLELSGVVEMGLSTLRLLCTSLTSDGLLKVIKETRTIGGQGRQFYTYIAAQPIVLNQPQYNPPDVKTPASAFENSYICAPLVRRE